MSSGGMTSLLHPLLGQTRHVYHSKTILDMYSENDIGPWTYDGGWS